MSSSMDLKRLKAGTFLSIESLIILTLAQSELFLMVVGFALKS